MLTDSQNKKQIRDVVREAFERLGGADWLVTFANANWENARVFVSLVGRLIPTELTGKNGGELTIKIIKEGEIDISQAPGQTYENNDQPRLPPPGTH